MTSNLMKLKHQYITSHLCVYINNINSPVNSINHIYYQSVWSGIKELYTQVKIISLITRQSYGTNGRENQSARKQNQTKVGT